MVKTQDASHQRVRLRAIGFSVVVGFSLMAVKFYAYWLTQSSALLSDALESIINVMASAFALWSLLLSARPPDRSHPYGHGKIEYFSAGFEGGLIVIAAFGIFYVGLPRIFQPQEIPRLDAGLMLLAFTGTANLLLGLGLMSAGKRTRSIVLIADGKHVLTDVFTTLGVFSGLLLVHFTGYLWLDGLIAVSMGFLILYTGAKLVRQAFGGLMDEASPELLEEITSVLSKERKESWIDIHQLRAWRAGTQIRVDFHLVLPQDYTIREISNEISHVRNALRAHFEGQADVLVHTDPCNDRECPACARQRCGLRKRPTLYQTLWHREGLISRDQ